MLLWKASELVLMLGAHRVGCYQGGRVGVTRARGMGSALTSKTSSCQGVENLLEKPKLDVKCQRGAGCKALCSKHTWPHKHLPQLVKAHTDFKVNFFADFDNHVA
jgi:hypothetical protein